MKYPALFLAALSLAAGWTVGCYLAHAACIVARNSWQQRKRPVLPEFPR